MNKELTSVHIVDAYLLNPTNPIPVNIIGAGGTGSHMLTALAKINQSLITLGHPGFAVRIFDCDTVSPSNMGRQLFTTAEIGLNKAVCLINRVNRFFGTDWKAVAKRYDRFLLTHSKDQYYACLTITCVDTVVSRFEIAEILTDQQESKKTSAYNIPKYWVDFGNSQYTGQVILATVGTIKQPKSERYTPVGNLNFITKEFKNLLLEAEQTDDSPSCSLEDALGKQDLFINATLANIGASLIWNMLRDGIIENRGFFINLKAFITQPLKVA